MAENNTDPLTGLPGQVESLREANQKLQAEVRAMEEDVRFLRALEAAGVDTWDGYYDARCDMQS